MNPGESAKASWEVECANTCYNFSATVEGIPNYISLFSFLFPFFLVPSSFSPPFLLLLFFSYLFSNLVFSTRIHIWKCSVCKVAPFTGIPSLSVRGCNWWYSKYFLQLILLLLLYFVFCMLLVNGVWLLMNVPLDFEERGEGREEGLLTRSN